MNVIIIRYSEIHLKGRNRGYFESVLIKNIKTVLSGYEYTFTKNTARYTITNYSQEQEAEIIDILSAVFGISSISIAKQVDTDMEQIASACISLSHTSGTFKVETNRADKTYELNSQEISAKIGGSILASNPKLRVDVHNPDWIIYIDVRENKKTFCYREAIKCVNGMPVGTGGKGVLLLSGGIDSPVAGYMMAKRGMSLRALHFHSYPYTSALAKEKVITLAKLMKKYCINLTIDIVNVADIQTAIHNSCREDYMITILRRFMMRIAQRVADRIDASVLITGESLGQVASQTVESLVSTSSVTDKLILRPLIGFDKEEIIAIAKRIGTFDTSIQPFEDCCTVFLPKSPVIHPKLSDVVRIESALDIDTLVEQSLSNIETIIL
ncbi:MAG: tRNA 4-thiouridine(8) synthase ThiI [Clostridia bacterium]|nr:tRNA 4-thiouridine(8) synthase ThiI [Clostridia bacterium]